MPSPRYTGPRHEDDHRPGRTPTGRRPSERRRPSASRPRWRSRRLSARLCLEEVDLAALAQRHDRLLPRWPATEVPAPPLLPAEDDLRADVGHLDLEDRLDRLADLDLVGVHRDLEAHLVVLVLERGRLLGHERTQDDLAGGSPWASVSCSFLSPGRPNTTRGCRTTSVTVTWFGRATESHGMFRLPRSTASVSSATISSVGAAATPRPRRRLSIAFVLGSAGRR